MTTKGIPSVPDVPTKFNDFDLYRILEPLKRIIDIRQGQFDPADRWITQQDLVDLGLQNEATVGTPVVVVPPVNVFTFNLVGDIEGGPTQMADGTNPINMSTIINLPNVVCIDGGDATSTYPQDPNGPYGVVQSPSNFITEINGIQFSTGTAKYNWIGFNITEVSPDNFDISFGAQAELGVVCPGYTYTFINTVTWRINGFDVTNMFSPGRRLRFIDGTETYFGNILTSSFTGGNTTMTMDMDAGDALTATVSEVCLVTDGTGWTPIAGDPFGGTPINDITSGYIGGTKYWIAVGNAGRIRYSTDKGVTWSVSTSGTTENLNQVEYNDDSETFIAVGNGGVVCRSTNGTTWTANTSEILAAITDGPGDIFGIAYDFNNVDYWAVYVRFNAAGTTGTCYSTDDGVNWQAGDSVVGSIATGTSKMTVRRTAGGSNGIMFHVGQDAYLIATADDITASLLYNTSGQPSATDAASIYAGTPTTQDAIVKGTELNDGQSTLDDVTMGSSQLFGVAWSPTLERLVVAGEDSKIMTYELADFDDGVADFGYLQSNGGNPSATYLCVHWDDDDSFFIAGNNQGQIVRSSNGLGAIPDPITFTGFTLIAADPFTGTRINRILSGNIAGTIWWVAIGPGGKLYTSTDAGVTWTVRTTGTTENLITIGYNPANQQFVVGATGGEFLSSTNGTTWTLDTTTLPALGGAGNNDVRALQWDGVAGLWWFEISYNASVTGRTYSTDNLLTTFTLRDSSSGMTPTPTNGKSCISPAGQIVFPFNASASYGFYTSATDTNESTMANPVNGQAIVMAVGPGSNGFVNNWIAGQNDGSFKRYGNNTLGTGGTIRGKIDNESEALATGRINAFAYSTISSRWLAVCDANEMFVMDQSAFDAPRFAWAEVINPFTGNITDCHYDPTDDIFIAVGDNGEIGRSTDGIS